jgi:hypothetical protein
MFEVLHFRNLSSRGKCQSPMKPKGPAIMKINEATSGQYTTLILMATDDQKIGRRILEHLRKKDIRELSTKDPHRTAKEVVHQIMAEVLTQLILHIACTMAVQPTTAPKISLSFLSQKENWTKIPHNLRSNPHPKKSITPCNGFLTTNDIPHLILRLFHHRLIKIAKPNLRHTTNHTTMPQPTILNLHQLHK